MRTTKAHISSTIGQADQYICVCTLDSIISLVSTCISRLYLASEPGQSGLHQTRSETPKTDVLYVALLMSVCTFKISVLNHYNQPISFTALNYKSTLHMSLVVRKPVFEVSDQVPHKPGCTVTEDG